MHNLINLSKKYKFEIILILFSIIFSSWLMFSTFSYANGNMLIASKAWSDFGSHIPLIRSFSLGNNFPPEYPLFSGQPIKYHFLFYTFAGILERIGLPIDYALNIPSIFGFSLLFIMIYIFAKKIFKSTAVAILSVIFFLFNGSLSFIKYFSEHPISQSTLLGILSNNSFPSFGPYDHTSIVSAFWNLNIYTNQRHLALSFALSLFILYLFLNLETFSDKKKAILTSILIGISLGISFILNMAVFLMTFVVLFSFFVFLKKERLFIFITLVFSAIVSFPLYKYMNSIPSNYQFNFHPGYLVEQLNFVNFLNYWWMNLGFHLILIPIGFFLAAKFNKKIFISFFLLFVIGNLIQFSPEIAANHKFFNYFLIVGSMFSAYALVELWKRKDVLKPVVVILFFLLIFSGVIDFFPIFNDGKIALADKSDPDVQWITKNTPPNSIFLNTQFFMDKASVAGRKIFLGWPYFAWSQGYDTLARDNLRKELLNTTSLSFFCESVRDNALNFVEINNSREVLINKSFFENNFERLYTNESVGYYIFNLKSCESSL